MEDARPWLWAAAGGLISAGMEGVWLAIGPLHPSLVDGAVAVSVTALVAVPLALGFAVVTREGPRAMVSSALVLGAAAAVVHGGALAVAAHLALGLAALRVPLRPLVALLAISAALWLVPGRRAASPGIRTVVVTVDGLRSDAWPALRGTADLAVHGRRLLGVAPSADAEVALDAVLRGRMPWRTGGTPLAEHQRRQGCDTGAFVSRAVGPRAGFETFDDARADLRLVPRTALGKLLALPEPVERPAWVTAGVAAHWLGSRAGCAFAWVHLTDPLAPLEPPPPWDERFYEGRDPRAPGHPGLPVELRTSFPGVRDPEFVRATYLGEVGVVDEAIATIAAAAGPDARMAVVGLGGIAFGPERWLEKGFDAQTLEVPVALRGDAPMLHQTISLADVYGWLVGDEIDARPWAVDGEDWGVRAAQSWRFSVGGQITDVFPEGDDGDRARRSLMLDLEQQRLEAARAPR